MENIIVASENKIRAIIREEIRQWMPTNLPDSMPELMTRSQAGSYLGCSPMTVDNYHKRGIIDKVTLVDEETGTALNRSPRFKKSQLDKLKLARRK